MARMPEFTAGEKAMLAALTVFVLIVMCYGLWAAAGVTIAR